MKKMELNSNQIMLELIDYILKEDLVNKFDLNTIKDSANSFYENFYASKHRKTKQKLVEEIEKFSLYDMSNYNGYETAIIPNLIMVLSIFKPEFVRKLTSNSDNKKYMDFGGLKRKVSPPVEAYEYVGNNKLDISPTHRSYGLLFE
ncbi:hypothetical protein [Winogradskyella pulchriflava]|uniref:Uncharacterized protein n=1 Tax=Winogradskyella pulchriflava TaxID=1110688 RepID=A0ABV6Q8G5_9FLAO